MCFNKNFNDWIIFVLRDKFCWGIVVVIVNLLKVFKMMVRMININIVNG